MDTLHDVTITITHHIIFPPITHNKHQRLMFVGLMLIAVDTDTYLYYSRDCHIAEQMP